MKAVILLLSIIEGPIDQEIIRNITISLDDFEIIFERLNTVFKAFVTSLGITGIKSIEND